MGELIRTPFTQTAKYLAACRRRAKRPTKTYGDVFAQIESETGGMLDNDEFTRRVDERCKALGIPTD